MQTTLTLVEFLDLVSSETEQTIVTHSRTLPRGALSRPYLKLSEVLPESRGGERAVKYKHALGAPASEETILRWSGDKGCTLPEDLRDLLHYVNGIHLWARTDTGRAYTGLAPIEEWETARVKMYGANSDPSLLEDRFVAISYHQDGAAYVVLDVTTGEYYLMDSAGPDTESCIGASVGHLLWWLWQSRILPSKSVQAA